MPQILPLIAAGATAQRLINSIVRAIEPVLPGYTGFQRL